MNLIEQMRLNVLMPKTLQDMYIDDEIDDEKYKAITIDLMKMRDDILKAVDDNYILRKK